jgi:hypothetical protein
MLPVLLRNYLRLLEIKERFFQRNMYGQYKESEVKSLKSKLEDLQQAYNNLKGEAKTRITKEMEGYYDSIQNLEVARLGKLSESEEKRYNYLVSEYNNDGKKLNMKITDKMDIDQTLKIFRRYIDIETRGLESKTPPPILSKITTITPANKNYSLFLVEISNTFPKLKAAVENKEKDKYDIYGSLYFMYYNFVYPSLFAPQATKLSPRKDLLSSKKPKNNMYLGLYLGAKLVDKKMDSFYLMLNCLEGKNLIEAGRIVKSQIGLLPLGLWTNSKIVRSDSDESLLYALFTEEDVGPLGKSLRSFIKGKKEEIEELKEENGLSLSYKAAIQAIESSGKNFKEDLLSLMDASMFTYDSRRGAIVGAILANSYPNLLDEYKYEFLDMEESDLKRLISVSQY